MSNITTSAYDIATGALININAFAPGQPLPTQIESTVLQVFNDLIDSYSTDEGFVYTQVQNQFYWTSGKYQYTIGNPVGGTFSATATSGSPTLTNVTVPSNLIVGGSLSDTAAAIPTGATVISIGSNQVLMSANATQNATLDTVTYTTPGDFPIPRPIRVRNSFTRVTTSAAAGLDYFIDVISFDRYNEIGLKTVPGPWPYVMAYQPTFPLGTLWVYPNPSIEGQVFLYTDLILSDFTTLQQTFSLPQGYARAFKKLLALELCPVFGKTPSPLLVLQAKEAKALLKNVNLSPVTTLRYDSDLIYSRHTDASWIVQGGFV
jgi:hypothetical protein